MIIDLQVLDELSYYHALRKESLRIKIKVRKKINQSKGNVV